MGVAAGSTPRLDFDAARRVRGRRRPGGHPPLCRVRRDRRRGDARDACAERPRPGRRRAHDLLPRVGHEADRRDRRHALRRRGSAGPASSVVGLPARGRSRPGRGDRVARPHPHVGPARRVDRGAHPRATLIRADAPDRAGLRAGLPARIAVPLRIGPVDPARRGHGGAVGPALRRGSRAAAHRTAGHGGHTLRPASCPWPGRDRARAPDPQSARRRDPHALHGARDAAGRRAVRDRHRPARLRASAPRHRERARPGTAPCCRGSGSTR